MDSHAHGAARLDWGRAAPSASHETHGLTFNNFDAGGVVPPPLGYTTPLTRQSGHDACARRGPDVDAPARGGVPPRGTQWAPRYRKTHAHDRASGRSSAGAWINWRLCPLLSVVLLAAVTCLWLAATLGGPSKPLVRKGVTAPRRTPVSRPRDSRPAMLDPDAFPALAKHEDCKGWSVGVGWAHSPLSRVENITRVLGPEMLANGDIAGPWALVADPFAVHHDGSWVMLFEFLGRDGHGRIGWASQTSDRLTAPWTAHGEVAGLEGDHLSFPCFERDPSSASYYMVPQATGQLITVYKSRHVEFPRQWHPVARIGGTLDAGDTTIKLHKGVWYLLGGLYHKRLKFTRPLLLVSKAGPEGPYTTHPQQPLAEVGDVIRAHFGRNGGNMVEMGDGSGRLVRYTQYYLRGDSRYGEIVRGHVLTLSPETLLEEFLPEAILMEPADVQSEPVLAKDVWRAAGAHHVQMIPTDRIPSGGSGYMVLVDGREPCEVTVDRPQYKRYWIMQDNLAFVVNPALKQRDALVAEAARLGARVVSTARAEFAPELAVLPLCAGHSLTQATVAALYTAGMWPWGGGGSRPRSVDRVRGEHRPTTGSSTALRLAAVREPGDSVALATAAAHAAPANGSATRSSKRSPPPMLLDFNFRSTRNSLGGRPSMCPTPEQVMQALTERLTSKAHSSSSAGSASPKR